ncbi:hypothetical protein BDF19DRAFT_441507 [Syncephalis fuscata]|nr:hypothetical protein BDF19DRAFT_441507 [Syncephalis fuscata]
MLILLLVICIFAQINHTCAKITLFNNTSDPIVLSSNDVFLHPESYYRYEGIAFVWHFADYKNSSIKCSFPPVNVSNPTIQNIAKDAYQHKDFAVVIGSQSTNNANCDTKEQVRFPSVKLLILASNAPPIFSVDYDQIKYKWIYFTIVSSKTKHIYKDLTVLLQVLATLLYVFARVIILAKLKLLKRNLLLIAFGIGFIYSISDNDSYLLDHLWDALPWITIAIFCGSALWFGFTSYRLKRHHEGRRKFIQLACITLLALFTYVLFPICYIFSPVTEAAPKPDEVFKTEFMFDTVYMIRALIFSTILGLQWPYSSKLTEPEIREPLGGMTTIGYESKVEEVPIQWRLTRKITRMIKR